LYQRRIELNPPLLNEAHDTPSRDGLRDGLGPKDGIDRHWATALKVGVPVRAGPSHYAVLNQG
jgi:hypothetical protein